MGEGAYPCEADNISNVQENILPLILPTIPTPAPRTKGITFIIKITTVIPSQVTDIVRYSRQPPPLPLPQL